MAIFCSYKNGISELEILFLLIVKNIHILTVTITFLVPYETGVIKNLPVNTSRTDRRFKQANLTLTTFFTNRNCQVKLPFIKRPIYPKAYML